MNVIFIIILATALFSLLVWGIRTLPRERWQIIAAAPTRKSATGWDGVNYTYYGLFSANAAVLAVGLYYVLLRAIGISALWAALAMAFMLGACIPASRIVARVVEKKAHTFTVGGATFVGIILAPWIILLTNLIMARFSDQGALPVAVMAAFAIAYAVGEGIGRLACLSFGCCYGKPLAACSSWLKRVFSGRGAVFQGATKKAAYASGFAGLPLLPVQAITAFVNTTTALAGLWLFLQGDYTLAFLGVLAVTQGWRFFSEFFRADYRGVGKISAYQWMGLAAVLYTALMLPFFVGVSATTPRADMAAGLGALWGPAPILLLQALWAVIFIYMGKSTVTKACISFRVVLD